MIKLGISITRAWATCLDSPPSASNSHQLIKNYSSFKLKTTTLCLNKSQSTSVQYYSSHLRPVSTSCRKSRFFAFVPFAPGKLSPGEYIYLSFSSLLLSSLSQAILSHSQTWTYWHTSLQTQTHGSGTIATLHTTGAALFYNRKLASTPQPPKRDPGKCEMAQLLQERFVIVSVFLVSVTNDRPLSASQSSGGPTRTIRRSSVFSVSSALYHSFRQALLLFFITLWKQLNYTQLINGDPGASGWSSRLHPIYRSSFFFELHPFHPFSEQIKKMWSTTW